MQSTIVGGNALPAQVSGSLVAFFRPPHFVVIVLVLGITVALSQGIDFREKIPINKSFDEFPLQVGDWTGVRQKMEDKFVKELDLSDYVIVDYQNKNGKHVNCYLAYYESQKKGEAIHSPATCLPGSGWIFERSGRVSIPVKYQEDNSIRVNRALMQKGDFKQLSYFWFPQRGRILTNAYQLKLFAFWDALIKQRTDGALVRLITPVYEFEGTKEAEKRLQAFTGQIIPVFSEFIPD